MLNKEGVLVRSSTAGGGAGKAHNRDYFLGALRLADQPGVDSVYVARAHRSTFDHKYRIGVARALPNNRQPNRPWVIVTFITTDATMGLPDLHDERRKAVLVGSEDRPGPVVDDVGVPFVEVFEVRSGGRHGTSSRVGPPAGLGVQAKSTAGVHARSPP